MNPAARLLPLAAMLCWPLACIAAEPVPQWVDQSRSLAAQLGTELKGELGKALESGGPAAAIAVCRNRAPEIAARLSKESGAIVGRTALRVRNPANAPDGLQRAVLEQFAAELGSGRFTPPLEAVYEVRGATGVERRYMKAIPTDGICLTCHGPSIAPDVAAAIARDYPADAATGFQAGQLRGAFSVVWPAAPVASAR